MVDAAARRAERPELHPGHVPRLGRPRLLQRLLRSVQCQGADIYWRQVSDGIASKGFDAWWLDSDEPDFHSNLSIAETAAADGPDRRGPGAAYFNSYPLVHVEGVYDHLVAVKPDVRPFILTRSGFGGIQRASAAVWSGDVASRWDNLRDQISAGINFSMSGVPNWSHDIGGYTMEPLQSRRRRTSPNGASSTRAGSSSAPSRRSSAAMARISSARFSRCRRRARRPTARWSGTTGSATG